MVLPVYILARTPGAEGRTVEWTEICHHKKEKIFITHEPYRDLSRWTFASRKRPFMVYINNHCHNLSAHKTLEAAEKSAEKFAKEFA